MAKLEDLTVKEIKEKLDVEGIEYDNKAKKDELFDLLSGKGKRYKAILEFRDLQDGEHVYEKKDPFPRVGASVSEERIEELLSDKNKLKKPVIKEVE